MLSPLLGIRGNGEGVVASPLPLGSGSYEKSDRQPGRLAGLGGSELTLLATLPRGELSSNSNQPAGEPLWL